MSDPKRVNINTASVDELNELGGRYGKAIIRRRPYQSIEELVSKRTLNRTAFNRIKDRIAVR
jgi:DNA uptake protein ComE-like DNA-binding protein